MSELAPDPPLLPAWDYLRALAEQHGLADKGLEELQSHIPGLAVLPLIVPFLPGHEGSVSPSDMARINPDAAPREAVEKNVELGRKLRAHLPLLAASPNAQVRSRVQGFAPCLTNNMSSRCKPSSAKMFACDALCSPFL